MLFCVIEYTIIPLVAAHIEPNEQITESNLDPNSSKNSTKCEQLENIHEWNGLFEKVAYPYLVKATNRKFSDRNECFQNCVLHLGSSIL